jgi:hypothetical protein
MKVERVLSGAAATAEIIAQHVCVQNLLGTTLPRDVRLILRQFEESLATELKGDINDGRTSDEARKAQAS